MSGLVCGSCVVGSWLEGELYTGIAASQPHQHKVYIPFTCSGESERHGVGGRGKESSRLVSSIFATKSDIEGPSD